MSDLQKQWRQIREHPWLGHALLAILALVTLSGVLHLGRYNDDLAHRISALAARQGRLELINRETQWPVRERQVLSVLGQLRSQLWEAPTPAVAQAKIQDRLNMIVLQQKLKSANVRVGNLGSVAGTQLQRVRAELSFIFDPQTFIKTLVALLQERPGIIVRNLQFSSHSGTRVTLGLVFYFRN